MNFIPSDLRDRLRADAEKAERARDPVCAERLRQIADYEGDDAPGRARELGIEAYTVRYPAARELMQLVLLTEEGN